MAEEDPGRELPQRVRGAARPGPPARAPSSPAISDELRQRIRAAVTAERSGAVTEQDQAPEGEATDPGPPARSEPPGSAVRPARSEPPGSAVRPARSGPPARPLRVANAGPEADDDVTQWLGTARPPDAAKPPPAVRSRPGAESESGSGAEPALAVRPGAAGQAPAARRPPGRRSRVRRTAWFAAVVLIGILALGAIRFFGHPPISSAARAAAARQAARVRAAAATWVAQQVSRDVKVSCDPVMCAALEEQGFPSGELLVLGPASLVPLASAVVIETPAVLSLFGSSLATAWAPAVLASFGSGASLVSVRVITASGATSYQAKLSIDLADRKTAGAALLHDPQISVTPLASGQLTTGAVDSRLLLALAALAGHQPISIVRFGNDAPGASPGVPLRYAELAGRDPARRLSPAAYVKAGRGYLATLTAALRPASVVTTTMADGQAVLRVAFTAPSPLGLLSPQAPSS